MSHHLGVLRVAAVVLVMAVIMAAAVLFMHRRDTEHYLREPLTSPAYYDDYYADPSTRPAHTMLAADRSRAATRNARR